ncbi:MAG TPA: hypothetical protein VJ835_07995 [Fimbriimonadaceae bacterium]|nr:hypothetical protein [Fimbriimonadaceae bacterium]
MKPLPTDEKIAGKRKLEPDMDTQMILGCSGFVICSFSTYFLLIWPFFLWMDIEHISSLLRVASCLVPAYLGGFLAIRRFELAGAAGFIGGVLAGAIFIYLRFEQLFLEASAQRIDHPEYPPWIQWYAPLSLILLAVGMSVLGLVLESSRRKSSK